jgi:cation:H+ antiporter
MEMHWSPTVSIAVFLIAAATIGGVGTWLTRLADRLADRTGLGEAFVGAVFLGGATSLPGITASVTAAAQGLGTLALSNALGGIAAQTVFLAIADLFHRRVNLEHAAASLPNMMQTSLLIVLLAVVTAGISGPAYTVFGVHPVTPVLFVVYLAGQRMIRNAAGAATWRAVRTPETQPDVPQPSEPGEPSVAGLWTRFAVAAAAVVAAGWAVTRAGESIGASFGLTQTVVGGIFVAVTTSLPELVTTVAAVRQGALTLAVGGVIGGNAFDTLFAAVADLAYRDGSLYHAATRHEQLLVAVTIIMSGVLLLGLLRREKKGIAGIGFESFSILVLYMIWLGMSWS